MSLYENVLSAVGRTPLVALNRLYPQSTARVYGKLEALNPGGSIKDRTAATILQHALRTGKLTPGRTVIESSSGNMAIGLAQACRYMGLHFIAVVDPNANEQAVRILEAYGARIERVAEPDATGGYLNARIRRVEALLETIPGSYWPNQYTNPLNPQAHLETMHEILEALGTLDYLFAATSTCGTIMGCAEYVRARGLPTQIVAVDAVGSVLFGTPPARRLIPGHGAGRPSRLLDPALVDHLLHISDAECVAGCRRLLDREAILAGGSSGALVAALGKMLPLLPPDASCALILCDRGERYLDTIYSDAWVEQHFGALPVAGREAVPLRPAPVPLPAPSPATAA